MKRSLKEKWVAALRSGKYKQARGKLKGYVIGSNSVGHCCLGVLLDIVQPEGWQTDPNGCQVHVKASRSFRTGGFNQYINPSFAHSLGIPGGQQKVLGKMNDVGTGGFAAIADYIEAQIPTEDD